MNAVLQGLAGGAASKYVGQRVEEMGPDVRRSTSQCH